MQSQEIQEWLLNPVTKRVRRRAEEVVQEIKESWASGAFKDMESSEYARGRIEGLLELFQIEE